MKHSTPRNKLGGASIMVWGFAASSPGELVRVHVIMEKEDYREVIRNNAKHSAVKLSFGRRWTF